MCELATKEYPLFKAAPKTFGSAKACADVMKPKDKDILIGVVVGADRAMSKGGKGKWKKPLEGVVTICIGRPGSTEAVKAAFEEDLKSDPSLDRDSFIVVPVETTSVSSTLVRAHLQKINPETQNQKEIGQQLVENGYETQAVADYIIQHFGDLYLK